MNTLTELWGEPGSGKSHQAHEGWPGVFHVDTAFTSLGFRKAEVEPDPDEAGETWPVIASLYDWDESQAQQHYHYLSEWPSGTGFIPSDTETVVLDNAPDLRVLAVNHWAEEAGQDWPQQSQWGEINDMIDALLRELLQEHHVVVISQLKDEYRDGDKTGGKVRDGPKRMDYKADFRVKLEIDDENKRQAMMAKNRHMDTTSLPEMPFSLGDSVSLEQLTQLAGIPSEQV